MLAYIRKDMEDRFLFPGEYDNFYQIFDHDFDGARNMNRETAVKEFAAASEEWTIGLETLRILYRFTFATHSQLCRLLKTKELDDRKTLERILCKYIECGLINKFCLSQIPLTKIPDDAMVIYCLDHWAKYILGYFAKNKIALKTWKNSDCIFSGNFIFKRLASNEFYISLCETKGFGSVTLNDEQDFMFRGRSMRVSGWFQVRSGGKREEILVETIRSSDLPLNWLHKVDRYLTPFIKENFVSRYLSSDPLWIFITDSEDSALQTAKTFEKMTECKRYRLITTEELCKGLDKACFLKYEDGNLTARRMKFFAVS